MKAKATMKNYFELLGCEFVAGVKSLNEAAVHICDVEVPDRYGAFKEGRCTTFVFNHATLLHNEVLLLSHLGSKPKISPQTAAIQSKEMILAYYTTPWYEGTDDEDEMHKSVTNEDFEWYETFEQSLWLAAITKDASLLSVLADYLEPWMKPEWLPVPVDETWSYFMMSLTAPWRSMPMKEIDELEKKILSNRKREPKTLFKAWQAALSGNQADYEKHLLHSVKNFDKTAESEITNPTQPIAMSQSLVMNLATMLGRDQPVFEERLMARLPSTESVGLS